MQSLKLTDDVVSAMRALGCEPTCHWCERHLDVGDEVSFRPVPGATIGLGKTLGLSALACAVCANKDLTLAVEQRVRNEAQARLSAAARPAHERERARDARNARSGGCFMASDGTLF